MSSSTQSVSYNPGDENKYNSLIKSYSIGLLNLVRNPTFRQTVLSDCNLYFDGDKNVLFHKLNQSCQNFGMNLLDSIQSSLILNNGLISSLEPNANLLYPNISTTTYLNVLAQGISGIPYYGDTLFLQVYIPEKYPTGPNLIPTIVMLYDDVEVTDALKYNGNSWEYIQVDSNYAKQNLCWVISTNESGIKASQIVNYYQQNNNVIETKISSVTPRAECAKLVRFDEFLIQDIKEGWWGGKADMGMVVDRTVINTYIRPIEPVQYFNTWKIGSLNKWCKVDFHQGDILFKLKNEGVDKKLEKKEACGWIIYEIDNYRKYNKTMPIPNCFVQKFSYKSKQTPFAVETYLGGMNVLQIPTGQLGSGNIRMVREFTRADFQSNKYNDQQ